MPRGRPVSTNTGHKPIRVSASPDTLAKLDALALPGETRPATLARVVAEYIARKEKE